MPKIQKPGVADVPLMKALLDDAAAQGHVLPRESHEIYENLRDFLICRPPAGGVAGMVALHIDGADLAEVRSLVVSTAWRGQGIGLMLVRAAVDEARELGIRRVYALTRIPDFFVKLGFVVIDRMDLPSKVFKDCSRCPMLPQCDETALIIETGLAPKTAAVGTEPKGETA